MQCHLTTQRAYFSIGNVDLTDNIVIYLMDKGEADILFGYMRHDPLASNVNSLLRIKAIEERIKALDKGNESEIPILKRALQNEIEGSELLNIPYEIKAIPLNEVTMEELVKAFHTEDYDLVASLRAGLAQYEQKINFLS